MMVKEAEQLWDRLQRLVGKFSSRSRERRRSALIEQQASQTITKSQNRRSLSGTIAQAGAEEEAEETQK